MIIRSLGRVPYLETVEAMRGYTQRRDGAAPDELWLCEHEPVFTLGVAGQTEHVLRASEIPVVASDRGGQVTYHGPGQVVAYPLVDLQRLGIFVKEFVFRLEAAALQTLERYGITGHRVRGAPGVYVCLSEPFSHATLATRPPGTDPFEDLAKVAALGIKVTRHCTYHGLALNVAMDLEPFSRINPCGYAGLQITDLARLGIAATWPEVATVLGERLAAHLSPSR
ncbi:MAG: lipoyl(octanoyl) transferase LipB [Burkholderiales bacterium]|nr:MAG: lipoyl(octanoyl) transferase LipB [Burkholderiales bacterium]